MTLWDFLSSRGISSKVVFDAPVQLLLSSCALVDDPPAPGPRHFEGQVQVAIDQTLPMLSLQFKAPMGPYDYVLELNADPAESFRLWLPLDTLAGAVRSEGAAIFEFVDALSGHVLTSAERKTDADGNEWLEAIPGAPPAKLQGVNVSLLVEGSNGGAATLRLSPTVGGDDGVIALQLVPPTVLIGGGFGLELPIDAAGQRQAIVIDDSDRAKPPGVTSLGGQVVQTPADSNAWRGIVVRQMRFYLPQAIPLFGRHAVDAYFELGFDPTGTDFAVHTKVPATPLRSGIEVRIECRDPTARGLGGFVPTLVEVAIELSLNGRELSVPDVGGLNLMAGKPVIARARFSRLPPAPESTLAIGVESQGGEGIVSVHAPEGGVASRALIAAAALVTAIMADNPPQGSDASGVALHLLLAAALGASALLQNKGKVVVHSAEVQSRGAGAPLGDQLKLVIDYSVDVVVVPLDIGALSVALDDAQPMRVRYRGVGLTVNLKASGTEMLTFDFSRADMEIEDPGLWRVHSPASLFDVLGTRSGRGSTWIEVDLAFKLNLGPVQVSGATLRASLKAGGELDVSLRGLDVSLDVPGAISGRGRLQLMPGGGLAAMLGIGIVPLNLQASAKLIYEPAPAPAPPGSWWLFLRIANDLPGPVPIANTGLALYGIAGSFGLHAHPRPPNPVDPIGSALAWHSDDFLYAGDQLTIGAEAVIGTAPDFGFSFSSKGGLFLTVPDIALRATLWGRAMAPRARIDDRPDPGAPGITFRGIGIIDPADGVTVGLQGQLNVPVLMNAVLPLGAHFPVKKHAAEWFVYLGDDGAKVQGRTSGPVRVTVLPGLFKQRADAYVMLRGRGIDNWPYQRPGVKPGNYEGFVIATGFSFDVWFGPRPFAWAEVSGGADLLAATQPMLLAGFGRIAGSLHLGPFSVGVDAQLAFIAPDNAPAWLWARVCGRVDLLFDEISDCAEISVGSKAAPTLPPPSVHPLDATDGGAITGDLAYLINDRYERIFALPRSAADAPVVWADALVHLAFGITPAVPGSASGGQFDDASLKLPTAAPVGNSMLEYTWTLERLELWDVTDGGDGIKVAPVAPYSLAWQKGAAGPLGQQPQAGELVLFTHDGSLPLSRLMDGGAALLKSPLDDVGTLCRARVDARVGWAVGFGAASRGTGMQLPSDPLDPDPCVARFTALCSTGTTLLPGVWLGAGNAGVLPPPAWFEPLAITAASLACAPDRDFAGSLDLGRVCVPQPMEQRRVERWNTAHIVPSAPLTAARIWLALDAALLDAAGAPDALVRVSSASGAWFNDQRTGPLEDGRVALRFVPRVDGKQEAVDVLWRLSLPLAVIGLGGMTQAAIDAAAAYNAWLQNESQKFATAAANQPPPSTQTSGAAARAVLAPGRTYRLDVDLRWSGKVFQQDEGGNRVEVQPAQPPDGTKYLPPGGEAQDTLRSYYFKTAVRVGPPAAGPRPSTLPRYADLARLDYLFAWQDRFEPEMLERHLLGYTPQGDERFRFAEDTVNAHFGADHIAALAAAYGFDLVLQLRRVDVPDRAGAGGINPGAFVDLLLGWQPLAAPDLLSPSLQIKYAAVANAPCQQPKPGATLQGKPPAPLATRAWHEVFVQANETGTKKAAGRLPGVTFRTSRWRNPAHMLEGLGFANVGWGQVSGDVALTAVPAQLAGIVEGEDAAYEAAMAAIGLEGWPLADEPRVSQLWVRGLVGDAPAWLVAGVLIESPEPIDRPGRVRIESLVATMRLDRTPAVQWQIRRRDRLGARLLWLTTTPFTAHRWSIGPLPEGARRPPQLVLSLTETAGDPAISGVMALNTAPSFAGED